jgi:hypothetical protein
MECDDITYEVGMIVKHSSAHELGLGEIIKVTESTITINFDKAGIKEFDSKITPLEILQDKKIKIQGSNNKDNDVTIGVDVSYFARPDPDRFYSLKDLQKFPPPTSPGVYGWYFEKLPPGVPKGGCAVIETGLWLFRTKWHLLYIGKASNLEERVLYEHFQGNYVRGKSISSLRLTLGCLLYKDLGICLQKHHFVNKDYTFGQKGDQKLSNWMAKHARVTWVKTKDYVEFEKKTIDVYRLPLNTEDNPEPFDPLKDLKREFENIARSQKPRKGDFKKAYKEFVLKSVRNNYNRLAQGI